MDYVLVTSCFLVPRSRRDCSSSRNLDLDTEYKPALVPGALSVYFGAV